jgi:CubicO group peptidase (beta-lactamase class C family)
MEILMSAGFQMAIAKTLNERFIETERLPHAQILIARDGNILHRSTHGIGRADGTALDDQALFRIASMTKPVTTVAFMKLVEQGVVSLDTDVASVIPEFSALGPVVGDEGGEVRGRPVWSMRMIDLLRHTSGLTYGFMHRTPVDAAYRAASVLGVGSQHDADGFINALRAIPLEFEPGSRWNYSVSTDVLGVVVSRLARRPLGEIFSEWIFDPLGMSDTGFSVPADKLSRFTDAWMQHPSAGRVIADKAESSRWLTPPRFESGGGGLISTIDDYHRFCSMLSKGGRFGNARILSEASISQMTSNQLPNGGDLATMGRFAFPETGAEGTGFGLGFAVTLDPAATGMPGSVGDFYWSGIYSTAFFIDPVERLHGIIMTQLMPTGTEPLRRQLREAAYSLIA